MCRGASQEHRQFRETHPQNERGLRKSEFRNRRLVGYYWFRRNPFVSGRKRDGVCSKLWVLVSPWYGSELGGNEAGCAGEKSHPLLLPRSSVQLGSSPDAAGGRSCCQVKPCSLLLAVCKSQLSARVCVCMHACMCLCACV